VNLKRRRNRTIGLAGTRVEYGEADRRPDNNSARCSALG